MKVCDQLHILTAFPPATTRKEAQQASNKQSGRNGEEKILSLKEQNPTKLRINSLMKVFL
jgi:hypothetical protein